MDKSQWDPKPSKFSLDGTSVSGGGSKGYNVNVNTSFPIYNSPNGRNSIEGTAQYSQHLGGKFGNSRPNYGGAIRFTHRF
ncbi:diptericin-D-like [Episyrphus balteatus]|uniref:diptericin-D-like n=1 Tax=Episyrphus balteatus TaxID=286459 RepID=UPI0024853DDA|nr:diptericin-D-like [Episyrphus balteatus]